jgi:hypothetical protein
MLGGMRVQVNDCRGVGSDSVKRHLPNRGLLIWRQLYPLRKRRQVGNAQGVAESVGIWRGRLMFRGGKECGDHSAWGERRKRLPGHVEDQARRDQLVLGERARNQ